VLKIIAIPYSYRLLWDKVVSMRGDNNLPVIYGIVISCFALMAFVGSAFGEDYLPRWIEDVSGFLK